MVKDVYKEEIEALADLVKQMEKEWRVDPRSALDLIGESVLNILEERGKPDKSPDRGQNATPQ